MQCPDASFDFMQVFVRQPLLVQRGVGSKNKLTHYTYDMLSEDG